MPIGALRRSLVLGVAVVTLSAMWAQTQHGPPGQIGTTNNPFPDGPPGAMPSTDIMRRAQEMRNEERQKRLVADTDKLLALATQLQNDVSKTNRNVLSMDVIRRAEEIEKLAHAVKERMKG